MTSDNRAFDKQRRERALRYAFSKRHGSAMHDNGAYVTLGIRSVAEDIRVPGRQRSARPVNAR